MHHKGNAADGHQRLRHIAARGQQPRATAGGQDYRLSHARHLAILICAPIFFRGTFAGILPPTNEPLRGGAAPSAEQIPTRDSVERDTIEILTRVSRQPITPTLEQELMADLGFDSLQILEFVGELEDHFNIAVPLNALTHIKTVGAIVDEVRVLVSGVGGTST